MKKSDMKSDEIAKLAGVSRSTVSRVINNYANVPPKTREKVMRIIRQYNYYPNLSAQVLAGKSTRTIGLFLIDAEGHISGDIISSMLISSVIECASAHGYYVLTQIIRDTQDIESLRNVKECFHQRRIDGGVFIGAANHEPMIEELIAEGFMTAIVDQHIPGRNEANRLVINFDNELGAELAVDYVAGLNHSRIGIINGDMKRHAGPAKYRYFVQAMEKHGLQVNPSWVMPGNFNEESGYQAVNRLLKTEAELPTAIIAANDNVAFGAINALLEHNIRVPEDISVIGFDDHSLSARFKPALTTVRIDLADMMKQLTNALIEAIEEGRTVTTELTVGMSLVVRESCKKI